MQIDLIDYDHGISALDAGLYRPRLDAIHLMIEGARAAIIDTGINSAVPAVMEALRVKGLTPAAVDYVLLTHIHLDHAGGASQLMRLCPNAQLVVHPRGARHMADPVKLWAATVDVYGREEATRNYGEIIPIPKSRIIEATDGFRLDFRGRELRFFDAPGHARHHVVIRDSRAGHFFVGDCFGLAYLEVETDGRRFAFPTSSPSQFEPDLLHKTIDCVLGHQPEALYLTHYGKIGDVPRIAADLHRLIDAHVEMARATQASGAVGAERHALLKRGVREIIADEALRQGWRLSADELRAVFAIDDDLNAQGLAIWLDAQTAAA